MFYFQLFGLLSFSLVQFGSASLLVWFDLCLCCLVFRFCRFHLMLVLFVMRVLLWYVLLGFVLCLILSLAPCCFVSSLGFRNGLACHCLLLPSHVFHRGRFHACFAFTCIYLRCLAFSRVVLRLPLRSFVFSRFLLLSCVCLRAT